jgi:hypothetical protein
MVWSQFLQAVNDALGTEANRRGLEAFRARHIANAVIDLQRYIPSFRQGNSTKYTAANLTVQSKGMVGSLPTGAKVKAFYIYSTGPNDDPNCKRYKLDYYPWARRHEMLCGELDFRTWWGNCCWGPGGVCPPVPPVPPTPDPNNPNPFNWCHERAYVYSISPHLDTFVIYPPLNAYDTLLMVWDGYKSVFNPTDIVPYPIEASEPVSAYVLSKIHRLVDRDIQQGAADYGDYVLGRRALIREWRDNLVTDGQDDEYLSNILPPPGESFVTAGAEPIVLLQNITAIAGTTANCLAAIPTQVSGVPLVGPLTVMIFIGGIPQLWTLRTGTDATDVPNGICQPNDYLTAGAGLVWYQTNP